MSLREKPSAARSGRRCHGDHHRPQAGADDRAGADYRQPPVRFAYRVAGDHRAGRYAF